MITRALGSLGIAEINQAIANGERAAASRRRSARTAPAGGSRSTCPTASPPRRSSSGASRSRPGLRRPLGAVWPEVVTNEHAGRLECWVGRADISKAKPAPWPWLRTGGGDVFAPLPFGTDPRGRRVDGALIEHNWLLGSMPGQGKTSAVRVLVAAAALDPTVEMWLHELKGTGDLDPFEQAQPPVHLRHR